MAVHAGPINASPHSLLVLADLSSLVPPKTHSCGDSCHGRQSESQAAQTPQGTVIATTAMAMFGVAAMLLVAVVSTVYFGRRYRRRGDERGIELESQGEECKSEAVSSQLGNDFF